MVDSVTSVNIRNTFMLHLLQRRYLKRYFTYHHTLSCLKQNGSVTCNRLGHLFVKTSTEAFRRALRQPICFIERNVVILIYNYRLKKFF